MNLYVNKLETNAKKAASVSCGPRVLIVGANRSQKSGLVTALKHSLGLKEPGIDMTGIGLRRLAAAGAEDYTSTAHLASLTEALESVMTASVVVEGTTAKPKAPRYVVSTALQEALAGRPLAEDVSAMVRDALRGTANAVRSEIVSVIAPTGVIDQVRRSLPESAVGQFNDYVAKVGEGAEVDVLNAVAAAVASDMRALNKVAKREATARPEAPTEGEVQLLESTYAAALEAESAQRTAEAQAQALPILRQRVEQRLGALQAARQQVAQRAQPVALTFTSADVEASRVAFSAADLLLQRIERRLKMLQSAESIDPDKVVATCSVCRRNGTPGVFANARAALDAVGNSIVQAQQALAEQGASAGPDIVTPAERLYNEAVMALQRAEAALGAPPPPPVEPAASISERLQAARAAIAAQRAHDAEEAEAIQAKGKRAHLEVIKTTVAAVEKAQVESRITTFEASLAKLLPADYEDAFVARVFDGGKAVMDLGLESKDKRGAGFRPFACLSGFEKGLVTAALCPAWASKTGAAVRLFVQDEVGVEPQSLRVLAHTLTAAMLQPNSITMSVITTLPQLVTAEVVEEMQDAGWTVLFLQ